MRKAKKNNQSNVAKRNFHDHTLSFDFPFLNAEKCAEAKNDLFFFTIKPLSGKSKRERTFRPVCFSAEGASAVTSDNTGRGHPPGLPDRHASGRDREWRKDADAR